MASDQVWNDASSPALIGLGGERKRTDLAVLFSLFELVRSRSRFIPGIRLIHYFSASIYLQLGFIILDEVFDALDKYVKRYF